MYHYTKNPTLHQKSHKAAKSGTHNPETLPTPKPYKPQNQALQTRSRVWSPELSGNRPLDTSIEPKAPRTHRSLGIPKT